MRGFLGQATTIIPGKTPCLRCFFPPDRSPPREVFPIIGATCGVIGAIEATEAIKLLTGQGGAAGRPAFPLGRPFGSRRFRYGRKGSLLSRLRKIVINRAHLRIKINRIRNQNAWIP